VTSAPHPDTAPVEPAPPNVFTLCAGAPAFVAALRAELPACRTSLLAQFMTFEGDASGDEFADFLIDRARASVDVRLLLDHYSDVIANDIMPVRVHRRGELHDERSRTRALLTRLGANGIEIKRTAPPGRLWRHFAYRNHKKMVVLDDRVAFVGGINISDHNYAWHDFMVKIAGPLAADVARDFRSTWAGSTVAFGEPSPNADFVLNQGPGRPSISNELMRMIEGARHSIVIESPSLLGDAIERALLDAARRGVRVTLVVPARHNRWIFRVWVRKTIARLSHPNIEIHGYLGSDGMTHAKLTIVDERTVSFGSFNLFDLEGLTQKDLNVFTRDRAIVRGLGELVAGDIAASCPVPRPRTTFGRFSYVLLRSVVARRTRRLLRNPAWRSEYC